MMARAGAVVVAAILALSHVAPASATAPSTTLFRLRDTRLDELSGIARGIASPGVFWVQNDSGDSARIFALAASTGRVRGVFAVPDAANHDWEDLAVAPDAAGRPSIWIADIGDNDASRTEVQLYRVAEPHVGTSTDTTGKPDVWRLRYPPGPVNAESLAVTPRGRAYVITKSPDGRSVVLAVPPRPDPNRVQMMPQVASIRFQAHGGLIPASLQRLATGAAMSRDGRLLAVRTYTEAYVWRVSGDDVAAAVRTTPERVQLALRPQGEGVCFDGAALVLDSEHVGSPVDRVLLTTVLVPPSRSGSPAARSSASPSAQPPEALATSPAPSAAPGSAAASNRSNVLLAAIGVVVIAVGGGAAALRTRRRRE